MEGFLIREVFTNCWCTIHLSIVKYEFRPSPNLKLKSTESIYENRSFGPALIYTRWIQGPLNPRHLWNVRSIFWVRNKNEYHGSELESLLTVDLAKLLRRISGFFTHETGENNTCLPRLLGRLNKTVPKTVPGTGWMSDECPFLHGWVLGNQQVGRFSDLLQAAKSLNMVDINY